MFSSVWTTIGAVILLWFVAIITGKWSHKMLFAGIALILVASVLPAVGALIAIPTVLLVVLSNPAIFSGGLSNSWDALKKTFL